MEQAKIQELIDWALNYAAAVMAKQKKDPHDFATQADYAENYLLGKRDKACGDNDLACAQHYMKMRHWAAALGPLVVPVCLAFIEGYYTAKKACEVLGHPEWMAIGTCKFPTPANTSQKYWARKGMHDGLSDFSKMRVLKK
jgi:hypothetical protein